MGGPVKLTFKEKVERASELILAMAKEHGQGLVVANSLGKDSMVVWDLVKRVFPSAKGFIVTTRFKPQMTKAFMRQMTDKYPELSVYENSVDLPGTIADKDPNTCCQLLKVLPTRWALQDLRATCWVTGARRDEAATRKNFEEIQELDEGLTKLNPLFFFSEREIWQYVATRKLDVNPLYYDGYRSLGCAPCTEMVAEGEERAGRWPGTDKTECGIHSGPIMADRQGACG
jgi:phosphoadenosine phosphosulfate reductase